MDRLTKNASWLIICRIVQSVLGLFVSLLIARYLGPSNYGLINYASSLVVFVTPIAMLGYNNILVQEIVNEPENEGKILGTTLFCSGISSVICIIAILIFTFATNKNEPTTVLVCLLFSISLIFQVFEQIEYWFQAKLLSKYRAIIGLLAYTIVSIYKIFLLCSNKSVYWFAVSYTIDYLFISLSLYIIYRKLGGKKFSVSLAKAKQMFSKSYPYILSGMMITIFTQTDKIMLKELLNDTATGIYSAAVLLAGITMFVFQAVIDSYRPLIFENLKKSKKLFEKGIIELYSIIIYTALMQCICFTIFAGPIVKLTYGKNYLSAIPALRIVCWYTIFSFIGVIRNIWILAEEKQKYLIFINLCGAFVNVVLNFLLIPSIGICGAAIASLFTQFFTNVVTGIIIKPISYNNRLLAKSLNPRIAINTFKKILKTFY